MTEQKNITARASHVLVAPRKANLILKAIVGRKATTAIKDLSVVTKRAADPITKVIKQAVGNAVSLLGASPDSLVISEAYATKGRTLKRALVGGRSRTKPFERTASHITLRLKVASPKVVSVKSETSKEKQTAIKESKPKKVVKSKTSK